MVTLRAVAADIAVRCLCASVIFRIEIPFFVQDLGVGEAEFIAENGLFTVSLPDGRMVEINTDYEYDEEGYEDEE